MLVISTSAQHTLVRAVRPDGKRKWFVEDASARLQSVAPKHIVLDLGDAPDALHPDAPFPVLQTYRDDLAGAAAELLQTGWELVSAGEAPKAARL